MASQGGQHNAGVPPEALGPSSWTNHLEIKCRVVGLFADLTYLLRSKRRGRRSQFVPAQPHTPCCPKQSLKEPLSTPETKWWGLRDVYAGYAAPPVAPLGSGVESEPFARSNVMKMPGECVEKNRIKIH